MTNEQHFLAWLEDEHHRIAQEYRMKLWIEIQEAKKVMGENNNLYKPVLISSLKQIEMPPYKKYDGSLCKEEQKVLFDASRKPSKRDILIETVNKYLTAQATDTLQ